MTSDLYCDEALSGRTPIRKVVETDDVLAFHHTRPGGLARLEDENTSDDVQGFVTQSLQSGICLVAKDENGGIAGEIHT